MGNSDSMSDYICVHFHNATFECLAFAVLLKFLRRPMSNSTSNSSRLKILQTTRNYRWKKLLKSGKPPLKKLIALRRGNVLSRTSCLGMKSVSEATCGTTDDNSMQPSTATQSMQTYMIIIKYIVCESSHFAAELCGFLKIRVWRQTATSRTLS